MQYRSPFQLGAHIELLLFPGKVILLITNQFLLVVNGTRSTFRLIATLHTSEKVILVIMIIILTNWYNKYISI